MVDIEPNLEEEIRRATQFVIRARENGFQKLGITVKGPIMKRSGSGDRYESEVEVDFENASGIFDVLEFHVYRDGKAVVSREEVEGWLTEAVDSVIARWLSKAEGGRV